ncbi:hypothetical protein ES703_102908 [subsurface metagenome]
MPRLGLLKVSVHLPDQFHDALDGLVQPHLADQLRHFPHYRLGAGFQVFVESRIGWLLKPGYPRLEVPPDELGNSVRQVAQVVGQVAVVAPLKSLRGKAGVLAQHHIPHQVVAHRVHPHQVDQVQRPHHVPQGLGHLLLAHQPPAVGEDSPGQGDVSCHQHGGPVDGVGGEDVLTNQVHISGPPVFEAFLVFGIAHGGNVVGEGVEPDVVDIVGVEGQLHAPGQPGLGPRDAQVPQRLAQKAQHLVAPGIGLDEPGVLPDVLDEPLLVGRHAEEPVPLLDLLHLPELPRVQFSLGDEPLLRDRVPPFVLVLVQLAFII